MGVFEFMIGRKKQTPGELAKERLKVVLVHDRLKVNPEVLEMIKPNCSPLFRAASMSMSRICRLVSHVKAA